MLRTQTERPVKALARLSKSAAPVTAALTLAVYAGCVLPRPALAADLPAQAAPSGFRSTNNSSGGRILDGALPGVGSETEALHAGLHRLGSYFGATLEITSAIRSRDDHATTVFFRANLKGTPLTGLSIIAFASKDASRESVLFDASPNFSKNLPALIARLKSMPLPMSKGAIGGEQASAVTPPVIPPLRSHRAADNTVGISVPDGWTVPVLGDGRVIVQGPNKQFLSVNISTQFITADSPRAAQAQQMLQFARGTTKTLLPIAPFTGDVAQDFVNAMPAFLRWRDVPDPQIHLDYSKATRPGWAMVGGTRTDDGVKSRFVGQVAALNTGSDSWMLIQWMIASPVDSFSEDAPVMLAIQRSLTYNAAADRQKKAAETAAFVAGTQAAIASSRAEHEQYIAGAESRFQGSMAAAQASQDAIDRSAAGMIHYIQGTSVLEHTTTGFRGSLDAGWAQSIAEQDPQHYQVVPMKDYVKGVDY